MRVQPCCWATPLTSAAATRRPTSAAAARQASTAEMLAAPGALPSPAIDDDTWMTWPSSTARVTRPSWAAGRPPKRWRKVTAWPLPMRAWWSSSRLATPCLDRRNSSRLAWSQPRAAVAGSPAVAPARAAPWRASDRGVPKAFQRASARLAATRLRCLLVGCTRPLRRSRLGSSPDSPWNLGPRPGRPGRGWRSPPAARRPPGQPARRGGAPSSRAAGPHAPERASSLPSAAAGVGCTQRDSAGTDAGARARSGRAALALHRLPEERCQSPIAGQSPCPCPVGSQRPPKGVDRQQRHSYTRR
jgi:hypothetical protein